MDTIITVLGWVSGVYIVGSAIGAIVVGVVGWAILRAYTKP